ncbi:MAG: hypothetical protein ACM34K_15720 [Bacillota bacterium]
MCGGWDVWRMGCVEEGISEGRSLGRMEFVEGGIVMEGIVKDGIVKDGVWGRKEFDGGWNLWRMGF